MKKILLLLFAALTAAPALHAQFKVYKDKDLKEEVKEGDRLVYLGGILDPDANEVTMGEMFAPFIVPDDPNDNTTPIEGTVTVTGTGDYTAQWCGIDQSCITFKESLEKRGTVQSVGPLEVRNTAGLQLEMKFPEGSYGKVTAKIELLSDGEHVITFYTYYDYNSTSTGISQATGSQSGLRFDGQALRYSFDTSAPRAVQLYSVDGREVKSAALTATSGSLSLGDLPKGVYVYRLIENGKRTASGKALLK